MTANKVAAVRNPAEVSMTPVAPNTATIPLVKDGAMTAPMLPQAMMKPNSLCAWPGRKMSAIKLQNIETTKRLNTLSQM